MCICFYGNMFPAVLGELGVELRISRTRTVGLNDNFTFNFSEELSKCFSKNVPHFTFPPTTYEGSNFFTSSQNTCYCSLAFLVGMTRYVIVALIRLSLKASDVQHLFTCSLAICISYLEHCLFKFSAHLAIGLSFLVIMMIFFSTEV